VEEQGQIQGTGLGDLVHHLVQPLPPALGARAGHGVEGVDGGERVLVDGMALVEIVLGEEPDPRELGKEPAQEPRLVHAAQGRPHASLVAEQPEKAAARLA
jgi:hypothetical protein